MEVGGGSALAAWLRSEWLNYDADASDTLEFEEVMALLHHLNLRIDKKVFKATTWKAVDADGSNHLSFPEFVKLYQTLMDLQELFPTYSQFSTVHAAAPHGRLMSLAQCAQWLCKVQRELVGEQDLDPARRLLLSAALTEYPSAAFGDALTFAQWSEFVSSGHNTWFDAYKATVYQPMDQPLAHYYMASSHNTYLLKRARA